MHYRRTAFLTLLILLSGRAFADTKLRCMADSGYPVHPSLEAPGYEHDRYGTWPREQVFWFGGFVSSFDGRDDDNGDGDPDLLAIPQWVAYEIKRYGGGDRYPTAKPSPNRPIPWYELPELRWLAIAEGTSNWRINKSYTGWGVHPLPALGHKINVATSP